MKNLIKVYNLGRLSYKNAFKIQKYFVNSHLTSPSPSPDVLLLVEHDPVYTVGLRRTQYKEQDLEKLKLLGAGIEYTNRGGLITFHGPGQLVAYPILNLKNYTPSIKWYVCQLESAIVNLCLNSYNLNANRLCKLGYTGVWVNEAKIAAVGIHCTKYITYHGSALNCNVNLDWFNHIVPCGIQDKKVTSLSQLVNREVTVNEVIPKFVNEFQKLFSANTEFISKKDTDELIQKVEKQ